MVLLLVIVVGVFVLLTLGLRMATWRAMIAIARAGAQAKAEVASPDQLTPRQSELLVQMGRLGFTPDTPFRVLLPGKAPGIYASARGMDDMAWFRSMAIEGQDQSGLSLITYFPGGRLVTASSASQAVDPTEVIQCIPDVAPGKLFSLHEDALAAVTARGVEPRTLPPALPLLAEEEWRDEAQTILSRGVLRQILSSREFGASPTATLPVSGRADLGEIVALLRGAA